MSAFDIDIITLNLNGNTKEKVFDEMSQMLLDSKYIDNKEEFQRALYEREDIGITGLGNHIAIPHGKSDSVKKTGLAIGKAQHDIEWETHDDKPVRFVIMFSVPNDDEYAKKHLKLLTEVAKKLADDEIVEKLLNAQTKDEIINILS